MRLCRSLRLPRVDGSISLVQQRAGKGILAGIRRADPFMPLGCPYEDKCTVVETQTCWTSKIVYQLSCSRCPAEYRGTSGHKRCSEHWRALDSGDTRYAIARHYQAQHPDWKEDGQAGPPFLYKAISGGMVNGDLQRYILEALLIREGKEQGKTLLNSRGEWARVALKRLAILED